MELNFQKASPEAARRLLLFVIAIFLETTEPACEILSVLFGCVVLQNNLHDVFKMRKQLVKKA